MLVKIIGKKLVVEGKEEIHRKIEMLQEQYLWKIMKQLIYGSLMSRKENFSKMKKAWMKMNKFWIEAEMKFLRREKRKKNTDEKLGSRKKKKDNLANANENASGSKRSKRSFGEKEEMINETVSGDEAELQSMMKFAKFFSRPEGILDRA